MSAINWSNVLSYTGAVGVPTANIQEDSADALALMGIGEGVIKQRWSVDGVRKFLPITDGVFIGADSPNGVHRAGLAITTTGTTGNIRVVDR